MSTTERSDLDGLLHAAQDPDPRLQMHALHALSLSHPAHAAPLILDALAAGAPDVRALAVRLAGRLRPPGTISALGAVLGGSDPALALQAAAVLGQMRDPQATSLLRAAAQSELPAVRAAAERALAAGGASVAAGRGGPSAAPSAGQRPQQVQVIERLLARLADRSSPARHAAMQALRELGEPALEMLRDRLAHGDELERVQAAWGLGEMGVEEAAEPLAGALDDPAPTVRAQAVLALGMVPGQRAAAAVRRHLGDDDPAVRARARYVLAGMGEDRTAPAPAEAAPEPGPATAAVAEPTQEAAPESASDAAADEPPPEQPQLSAAEDAEPRTAGPPPTMPGGGAGGPVPLPRPSHRLPSAGYWQPRTESPVWTWLALLAFVAVAVVTYLAVRRILPSALPTQARADAAAQGLPAPGRAFAGPERASPLAPAAPPVLQEARRSCRAGVVGGDPRLRRRPTTGPRRPDMIVGPPVGRAVQMTCGGDRWARLDGRGAETAPYSPRPVAVPDT